MMLVLMVLVLALVLMVLVWLEWQGGLCGSCPARRSSNRYRETMRPMEVVVRDGWKQPGWW
jgi:hypothetical protein